MTDRIISEMVKIRIPAIGVVLVTLVAFFVTFVFVNNISITGQYNKFAGFFVNLQGRSAFHFVFAWIKLLYLICILVTREMASIGQYMIIIVLITVSAFLAKEMRLILMESFGGILGLASIWICSVFVEYMTNVRSSLIIEICYWIIVLFVISCALVVFEYEIISISGERRAYEENR